MDRVSWSLGLFSGNRLLEVGLTRIREIMGYNEIGLCAQNINTISRSKFMKFWRVYVTVSTERETSLSITCFSNPKLTTLNDNVHDLQLLGELDNSQANPMATYVCPKQNHVP
jgi:hypothetical protein